MHTVVSGQSHYAFQSQTTLHNVGCAADELAACYVWHETCWRKAIHVRSFLHKKKGLHGHQDYVKRSVLPLRISGRHRRGHLNVRGSISLQRSPPNQTPMPQRKATPSRSGRSRKPVAEGGSRVVMPKMDVVPRTNAKVPCAARSVRVGGTRNFLALLSKHNRWKQRLRHLDNVPE